MMLRTIFVLSLFPSISLCFDVMTNLTDREYYALKAHQSFGKKGVASPEYQRVAKKCSENRRRVGDLLYVDRTPFLIDEPHLCDGAVFMLIAVHTNAPYMDRRDAIRQTWGSVRQVGNKRLKLVFFLGNSGFKVLQKQIVEESAKHRDIVQRDYMEHYRNMTRKHLTIMEWAASNCQHAEYILKVDDDTFVDIFHAVRFVQFNSVPGFYCSATAGARPHRRNKRNDKWMVTFREYRSNRYPVYCEGFGYLMKGSNVRDLYWCSVFSRFFWIDDVYVGGVLPQKLGIERQRFWIGHTYSYMLPSHASHRILDYIFLMAFHNEFMPSIWTKLWRAAVEYSMDISFNL